jgi:hypothetical protein
MASTSTPVTDEGQIRAVIADRAAAMRERDSEGFVAHYAPRRRVSQVLWVLATRA